ncbi:MAG: nucleoside-diphosphate kinase [Jatrophihabitantaceae bacterium]
MSRDNNVLIDELRHAEPFPARLTVSATKARLFSVDTYFVEAWQQLTELTPDPLEFAHRHGIVVLKPDACAGRRGSAIINWLAEHGFEAAYCARLRFDRHSLRALWRYQWNMATPQRRALQEQVMTSFDSLVVIVRRARPIRVPTTVYLTDLKGPSLPADRKPEHLRTVLKSTNAILNFVHTADEPADVIRELGIYFDTAQRSACLRTLLRHDEPADTRMLLEELESDHARACQDATDGPLCWDWLTQAVAGIPANLAGIEPLVRTVATDWGEP